MDEYQLYRQLRYLAMEEKWPNSGERVFPSVVISAAPDAEALAQLRTPWLLIRPGSGETDNQTPSIIRQNVDSVLGVKVGGDNMGQNTLIGANKASPDSSLGRGILEIQRPLYNIWRRLTQDNGVKIKHVGRGVVSADLMETMYHGARGFRWQAWINDYPGYQKAIGFTATGAVDLAWMNPDRWDFIESELRRIAGSVPVTDPGLGTGLVLADPRDESYNDTPGPGTWSYSLFSGYDTNEDNKTDAYSAPATVTVTVA